MSYEKYGIPKSLVLRVKKKLKNTALRERVQKVLEGVTKADLQNRQKVHALLKRVCMIIDEKPDERLQANIVRFVLAQKIDPNNTMHLIRLWKMFR
jgi:hypothetical protein